MAKEESPIVVTQASTGIHSDNAPIDQPAGTMRYCLNGTIENSDGGQRKVSNNMANYACTNRPEGFEFIGSCYLQDDTVFTIMTNSVTKRTQLGLIEKNSVYRTLVDTAVLGCKITNQCDIIFRVRRGNEWVVYWTDGYNLPRTFNITREYNFYTQAYQNYLKAGGVPSLYTAEKWDGPSFDLIKSYKTIPFFSDVEVIDTGNILPGSYNFAIQYVDEDLNPTEWVNVSNTVNIFNDNSGNPFEKIRGSRNMQTDSQAWPRANKSIKLTITNLDNSFPYYRIAIIQANGLTGTPNKALASDLFTTSDSNFIYTGNDGNLSEVSLEEILVDNEVIFAPKHIEQLENKLILLNGNGKGINWCEFQKYASKIYTDLALKQVLLNNIESEPNIKNAKSTFEWRGYMPGEVYSMGIVYVFRDGTISPTFHIPGKSSLNYRSKMSTYFLTSKYLDIHNCSTNNYWGNDAEGNSLVGKPVRHHRFPFRHEIGKPLYTRDSDVITIDKFRLTAVITLNPAWVPNPAPDDTPYPEDGSGDPLVIGYTFNYQKDGTPTVNNVSGSITDTDMGTTITIYDDTEELDNTTITLYGELDPASQLAGFQTALNERFIITYNYSTYVGSSSINNDVAEIFGFDFSNIEKPHPDVVGYYIVRNERTDDDKMVIDNAIIGPMTQFEQYKSFGLINPKQYYVTSGCTGAATPSAVLQYYDKGVWFFNPEFQYYQKKIDFNDFKVEGTYDEQSINLPTVSNKEGSQCNWGGSKGVYIEDVQAGTSYNPEVNKKKDKDDDGFDLLIGYRNTNVAYSLNSTSIVLPTKTRVFYLNAAAYQNFDGSTFYNVSVDNKIGEFIFEDSISPELFYNSTTKKNSLLYGAMVRDGINLYSNFLTRDYYKEHNNPALFGDQNVVDNFEVFNGDAQISSFNFVSSVYYDMVVADRAKKNKLWKIIAGAVLVVVGIVVAVFTAGAGLGITAVGAGLLAGLAISYGISLAVAGIKFEQFKKMVDVDYETGLKETVTDGGVFDTIRDTIERDDDTIRWFSDRVSNLYIESSVPFGLRSGLTCGVTDFIDAPVEYDELGFRTYLTEKLTVIDRDQGSGRLYKGFPTAEVYDMNLDFTRFNKEKIFIHLPVEFDCCGDSNEEHPLRVWWSETSFQEEKVDNFRVFLPNNYRDIEGVHGEITGAYRLGNSLFIQTKEGLWHLPQQLQERVTDQIVSFIGTGSFFSVAPRPVVDDELGSAGTQHKWGTVKTKNGVMSFSEIEGKAHLHGGKLKDTTLNGNRNFFENHLRSFLSQQLFETVGIKYPNDNNPANPNGIGIHAGYDSRFERIIVTKKDYLFLGDTSKIINEFDPVNDYEPGTIFINENGFNEIESIEMGTPVSIPLTDWDQVDSVLSKPVLVPKTATKLAPLVLTHGEAYMQGGDIVFKAYVSGSAQTQVVPINMNSCQNDSIQVTIHT